MTIDQVTSIQQNIIEHRGYCEVPSASDANTAYRVYVNSRLYSVSCNCKAGQHNQDCGHRVAVDRYFDDRRKQSKSAEIPYDPTKDSMSDGRTVAEAMAHDEASLAAAVERDSQPTKGVLVYTRKPVYTDESTDPFINAKLRETSQRHSCILCGRETKQVVCGRCLS